jgi:hypothetical protein
VAQAFWDSKQAEVTLTGGYLYPRLGVQIGPICERMFRARRQSIRQTTFHESLFSGLRISVTVSPIDCCSDELVEIAFLIRFLIM